MIFDRYREVIPNFSQFLEALQRPLPVVLRTNLLKADPSRLRAELEARGCRVTAYAWCPACLRVEGLDSPGSTLEYFLGHYHPQAITSVLPVLALDPQPGELVLDLCAAPGGKTSHMAERMRNQGLILANDVRPDRLKALRGKLDRLGVMNAAVTMYRGEQYPGAVRPQRVLVDAPCSAEGTLRAPEAFRRRPANGFLRRISGLQRRLLRRALELVVPGGVVVYSTCSYAPEENEEVVAEVLEAMPGVSLEEIDLPVEHSPGLRAWNGRRFPPSIERCVRVYPHQLDGTGFFIARLVKR